MEITVEVRNGKAQAKTASDEDAGDPCPLDFDPLRIKTIDLFVERLAAGAIQKRPELETLGEHLYVGLFTGAVRTFVEDRVRRSSENDRLKLRLKLPDPANTAGIDARLANLPWEYLYCRLAEGFFLTTRVHLLLSRYMPVDNLASDEDVAADALTIGVLYANPDDSELAAVAGDKIIEALNVLDEACDELVVDVLERPTLDNVVEWLTRIRPQVLHFIGHGGYDREAQEARIVLVNETGHSRPVSDSELAGLFNEASWFPTVVVLHLSEGGNQAFEQNLARLAPALIRAGVPAVVAMQHPFPVEAAKHFNKAFYRALANSEPIDVAVTRARIAYLRNVPGAYDNRAFGTPALYARAYSKVVREPLLAKEEETQGGRAGERDPGAQRAVSPAAGRRPAVTDPRTSAPASISTSASELGSRPDANGEDDDRSAEVNALVRAIVETGKRKMSLAAPPLHVNSKAVVYGWFKQLDTEFAEASRPDQLADPIHYEWVQAAPDGQLRSIAEAMERAARGEVGDD